MSDTDTRLMHTVDREIQIEVPPEVLTEAALRASTDPDATRTEIRDVLTDHIENDIEYLTPEGSSAVDAILQSKTDASGDVDSPS